MLMRILIFLIGIILTSISLCFLIIYLNLFNMGYSFCEYVNFIIRRFEIICIIPGLFCLIISMIKRKEKLK